MLWEKNSGETFEKLLQGLAPLSVGYDVRKDTRMQAQGQQLRVSEIYERRAISLNSVAVLAIPSTRPLFRMSIGSTRFTLEDGRREVSDEDAGGGRSEVEAG